MFSNFKDKIFLLLYFRDYANLKIQVIQILIELNKGNSKYTRMLEMDTTEIVSAAERMIYDLAPKLFLINQREHHWLDNRKAIIAKTYRGKIRTVFGESLNSWKKLCNCGFDEKNFVQDWSRIALKKTDNRWASCWVSGSTCRPRSCPGKDGPWKDRKHNQCRGEEFNIVSQTGDYIRSCDTVGIRYSYQGGKGYWLSNYNKRVDTKICPGREFSGMASNSYCTAEKWTITAHGKNCGDKIMHKDEVSLLGHHRKKYLTWGKLSIFWHYEEYLEVEKKKFVNWKHMKPPSWTIYLKTGTF